MVLILKIRLILSVNFDGQFGDGLSVSDSLCTAAPSPQKKLEKGCLWEREWLYTGQSQTDNPFLALVWKRPITKFPYPGLTRKTVCRCLVHRPHYSARLMILWSHGPGGFFFSDTPPKCVDRDCVGRRRTGTRHGKVNRSVREKRRIATENYCLSAMCFINSSISGCRFTSISRARPPEYRKF